VPSYLLTVLDPADPGSSSTASELSAPPARISHVTGSTIWSVGIDFSRFPPYTYNYKFTFCRIIPLQVSRSNVKLQTAENFMAILDLPMQEKVSKRERKD
jgi:hypothetical protein